MAKEEPSVKRGTDAAVGHGPVVTEERTPGPEWDKAHRELWGDTDSPNCTDPVRCITCWRMTPAGHEQCDYCRRAMR